MGIVLKSGEVREATRSGSNSQRRRTGRSRRYNPVARRTLRIHAVIVPQTRWQLYCQKLRQLERKWSFGGLLMFLIIGVLLMLVQRQVFS